MLYAVQVTKRMIVKVEDRSKPSRALSNWIYVVSFKSCIDDIVQMISLERICESRRIFFALL